MGASGAILRIFFSFTLRQPRTTILGRLARRVFIRCDILSSVAPLTVQVLMITTSLPLLLSTKCMLSESRAADDVAVRLIEGAAVGFEIDARHE